jgi:hypothetical protein
LHFLIFFVILHKFLHREKKINFFLQKLQFD